MKEEMILLAGFLGKRFTARQKNKFVDYIGRKMEKMSIPMHIITQKIGYNRVNKNVFIGNVKEAKTLVCVSYDTTTKVLWKNYQYYPLDTKRNLRSEMINTTFQYSLAVMTLILYYFYSQYIFSSGISSMGIFVSFITAFVSYKFIVGFANKYNFVRNTASIVIQLNLIESLKSRSDIAFVMTDRTCNSYTGYTQLKKILGTKESGKEIIILDCIAAGESLFFKYHNEKDISWKLRMKEKFKGINTEFQDLSKDEIMETPLQLFSNAIYITGGKMKDGHVVIANTRGGGDSAVDFEKTSILFQGLYSYLK